MLHYQLLQNKSGTIALLDDITTAREALESAMDDLRDDLEDQIADTAATWDDHLNNAFSIADDSASLMLTALKGYKVLTENNGGSWLRSMLGGGVGGVAASMLVDLFTGYLTSTGYEDVFNKQFYLDHYTTFGDETCLTVASESGDFKFKWHKIDRVEVPVLSDLLEVIGIDIQYNHAYGTYQLPNRITDGNVKIASENWVNAQGFLTQHQDLSSYALRSDLGRYATLNAPQITNPTFIKQVIETVQESTGVDPNTGEPIITTREVESNYTINLPAKTGTIALTSDIPNVSTLNQPLIIGGFLLDAKVQYTETNPDTGLVAIRKVPLADYIKNIVQETIAEMQANGQL